MSAPMKEFLNVAEVAEILGLRPVTIYRWCRAGRLTSVKIGKEWRIRREALDDLLGRSLRDQLSPGANRGESMHEASLETQLLALALLGREAGTSREAAALSLATERISARLHKRLVPLIGRIGFAALLRRALYLAQTESPELAALTVNEGGGPSIEGMRELAAAHTDDPELIESAFATLLAHFIALLDTFIGVPLARRVLGEGWPTLADGKEMAK